MKLLAGLFAIALACVGAPALAQGGDRVMKALEFADLRLMAAELDFAVTDDGGNADGHYYLEIKSDSGLMFGIYGMSCSKDDPQKDCLGLNAVASFTLSADADVLKVMDSIDYAFMKVYREEREIKVSRYVIFDGGITRENVKQNVLIFEQLADKIWAKLSDDGVLTD